MANDIANHFFGYGPQNQLDRFLGAFLRDGMQAHVPIPPDAEPLEDPAKNHRSRWEQIHVDQWGAFWIGPEIYWTCGGAYGVSMLTKKRERVFQPQALQLDGVRKLNLNDKTKSLWTPRPGWVPPSKEDAIAYCKFYSPWCPPFRWFGKIATDLYASGLRFVMNSIDLSNVGNDGSHEIIAHWSVDGPGKFYKDGHYAMCVETFDASADEDDEYLDHTDESAEMVRLHESAGENQPADPNLEKRP